MNSVFGIAFGTGGLSPELALAVALSVLMGVVLGLLGGGGSILTVPILLYALGAEPKVAIATSLLVVGITSIVGTIQHARKGNVRFKTGAIFGAFAMVGAYLGGRVAGFLPGSLLLGLFIAMMLVTAVMMLRSKPKSVDGSEDAPETAKPITAKRLGIIGLEGFFVGGFTGLVGAGGGFLVVPALVLLAGLPMRAAVGTSLFIISLKSFAGLAGYLSHVSIDLTPALIITVASVVGSLGGIHLSTRISPQKLRSTFGIFILVVATAMIYPQLPDAWVEAIFVTRWPFWVGGLAIGSFVLLLFLGAGKPLGVSTGFEDACAVMVEPTARRSWRIPFLGGIVLGGVVSAALGGSLAATTAMGSFDAMFALPFAAKAALFTGGGVLIGLGTRMAGGCTSGHGIVGMSILARSSLMATATFMATGFITTQLIALALG